MGDHRLSALTRWYGAPCDGDREHCYGISIDTLDNPGWKVEIHVAETALEARPFEAVRIDRSEDDWLHCSVRVPDRPNHNRVQARAFLAYCGPHNLAEAIGTFLDWAGSPAQR